MHETAASTPEKIVIEEHLSGFEPIEVFQYWTDPNLLVKWWPAQATLDPREGGEYYFAWPEQNWHLRGVYTTFEPGQRLGFTWKWDHDPAGVGPLEVLITMQPHEESGTLMTIEHGSFAHETADDRQGIVEGWMHFGMKLAGMKESSG